MIFNPNDKLSAPTLGGQDRSAGRTDDDDRHAAVRVVADFWSATVLAKNQEMVTSWAEKLPPADLKIAAGWIAPNWAKKDAANEKKEARYPRAPYKS